MATRNHYTNNIFIYVQKNPSLNYRRYVGNKIRISDETKKDPTLLVTTKTAKTYYATLFSHICVRNYGTQR